MTIAVMGPSLIVLLLATATLCRASDDYYEDDNEDYKYDPSEMVLCSKQETLALRNPVVVNRVITNEANLSIPKVSMMTRKNKRINSSVEMPKWSGVRDFIAQLAPLLNFTRCDNLRTTSFSNGTDLDLLCIQHSLLFQLDRMSAKYRNEETISYCYLSQSRCIPQMEELDFYCLAQQFREAVNGTIDTNNNNNTTTANDSIVDPIDKPIVELTIQDWSDIQVEIAHAIAEAKDLVHRHEFDDDRINCLHSYYKPIMNMGLLDFQCIRAAMLLAKER